MLVLIRVDNPEGMVWLQKFVARENIPHIPRHHFALSDPADYGDALYGVTEEQLVQIQRKFREKGKEWSKAIWKVAIDLSRPKIIPVLV